MSEKSETQIFSLGYRRWEKSFLGPVYRVFSIAINEAKIALGSRMVKLLMTLIYPYLIYFHDILPLAFCWSDRLQVKGVGFAGSYRKKNMVLKCQNCH